MVDAYYIAFCEACIKFGLHGNKDLESKLARYSAFLHKGVLDFLPFENVAFICRPPKKVNYDERRRLHSTSSGAVEWEDGVDNYFIHGVSFPNNAIWNKIVNRTISAKEAISLPNAEQRTTACQSIGYDGLLSELKAKKVHSETLKEQIPSWMNRKPKQLHYDLLEIDLKDDRDRPARFIKVECPSTGRETILRTDPNIKSVREALAWSFGVTGEQYILEAES